jgi:hypothetical protein
MYWYFACTHDAKALLKLGSVQLRRGRNDFQAYIKVGEAAGGFGRHR